MFYSVFRSLVLFLSLLVCWSVSASSIPNTASGYLVSFSSSTTSEIRFSPESLPCQGLLLSSGQVATAPACANVITDQIRVGGTINLLDNSRRIIGHLSFISMDMTAKGVLAVSGRGTSDDESLFPIAEIDAPDGETRAYFLQEDESITVRHTEVRLGDLGVKQGLQYQSLSSDVNPPPGGPVVSGNEVLCLVDGLGACVQNIHQQASHLDKRSAFVKRQSKGSATGCTFSGQSVFGVDNGVWTCSDCSDCGCSGGCRITDQNAGGVVQSSCACDGGGSCGTSQGTSGDACSATGGSASLTAGMFGVLVAVVAALSASI